MAKQSRVLLSLVLGVGLIATGCTGQEVPVTPVSEVKPTQISTPVPEIITPVTPTATLLSEPSLIPTADVTENPPETGLNCGDVFCQDLWDGVLLRPLSPENRNTIDLTYPYASGKRGFLEPHHGVEFPNPFGTPVRAVAEGEVVYAGNDDLTLLGPYTGFYGNVVILRHPERFEGKDLFSLYAHLSKFIVAEGDWVTAGQTLGEVGASGAADGSHLHLEIRVGENDYGKTVNPVLWFAPVVIQADHNAATLAGRIVDSAGEPLHEFAFALERFGEDGAISDRYYPITYVGYGVNPHPLLNENFVIPDIPPGDYRLAFVASRLYEFYFTLDPGALGFITIQLD